MKHNGAAAPNVQFNAAQKLTWVLSEKNTSVLLRQDNTAVSASCWALPQ